MQNFDATCDAIALLEKAMRESAQTAPLCIYSMLRSASRRLDKEINSYFREGK